MLHVPYELCVSVAISCLHNYSGLTPIQYLNRFLCVKALVGAVNKDKAQVVGAFSEFVKTSLTFISSYSAHIGTRTFPTQMCS